MEKTKVYIDACCHIADANKKGRAGKGKAACGVIIIEDNGQEHEYSKYLGEMTVPQAEFEGLVFALDKVVEHTRSDIEIWMDSELVVKWMNKVYRLKKDHIKPIYDKAVTFERRFKSVQYFHHPRTSQMAKKVDKIAQREYEKNNK